MEKVIGFLYATVKCGSCKHGDCVLPCGNVNKCVQNSNESSRWKFFSCRYENTATRVLSVGNSALTFHRCAACSLSDVCHPATQSDSFHHYNVTFARHVELVQLLMLMAKLSAFVYTAAARLYQSLTCRKKTKRSEA